MLVSWDIVFLLAGIETTDLYDGLTMDSEDENDEDWIEMCEDEPQQSVLCLFCSETFPSAEATYGHCKANHGFDIRKIQKVHRLDCFGYIKLINYIRNKVCAFPCKKVLPICA